MTRNNNRRRNNNRATNNNQHQNDSQNKDENKEEENFDADICSRLVESQVASNALTADDQCPICFIEW
jgi:hypothetical protein